MPLSIALFLAAAAVEVPAPPAIVPGGTIGVVRPAPVGRRPAPDGVFADAVENALLDAGFTVIPQPQHARHIASFAVKRTAYGAALAKGASAGPPLPMIGMAGGGAGVSIGLGSKVNVGQMVATELTLRIARRGESVPAWEGRAVTYQVTGTRNDDPAALARKLTAALLRNFDAPSGVLLSVP